MTIFVSIEALIIGSIACGIICCLFFLAGLLVAWKRAEREAERIAGRDSVVLDGRLLSQIEYFEEMERMDAQQLKEQTTRVYRNG